MIRNRLRNFLMCMAVIASVFVLAGSACGMSPDAGSDYPQVVLSNDVLRMQVFLPDATNGYYRGVRFDRSGMIGRVDWSGHTFFGEWKQSRHAPTGSDDVVGPAEEFGMSVPLGYADAKIGETFIKIGVGHLRKPVEPKYWFPNKYEIVKLAPWTVEHGADWIQFTQETSDDRGYGYRYVKRIGLETNTPAFVVTHRLTNTGTRTLDTDNYCHNFMVFDGQPVGPQNHAELSFSAPQAQTVRNIVSIEGRRISFLKEVPPGMGLYAELDGRTGTAADNDFKITNTEAGIGIAIKGDAAPVKMVFYAIGKAVCIEPFIQIVLDPGEVTSWKNEYRLSLL